MGLDRADRMYMTILVFDECMKACVREHGIRNERSDGSDNWKELHEIRLKKAVKEFETIALLVARISWNWPDCREAIPTEFLK